MNKDKKILYIVSFIVFAALLSTLFINVGASNIIAACLLVILTPLVCVIIRKRGSLSINKKEVLLLSVIVSVLYVVIIRFSGLYFGYYINPYYVSLERFLKMILPMIVIIISTEIIRYVLLAQKNKLVGVVVFLFCVLAEVIASGSLADFSTVNKFMDFVGMSLFPALSANIYYHYVSKKFGAAPNIAFRLITTLYVYVFSNVPAMSDALLACIKMFVPIIMLMMVSAMYEKKFKKAVQKGQKLSTVGLILSVAIVIGVAMIISCQFRFGALVIATESMTGEINKGDMIIYESYDDQVINEGQVIVFKEGQNLIVHRVVQIDHKGVETRYYTKGDANNDLDKGYRTEADIFGLTDVKIPYIGYPTLILKELLEGSN